MVLERSSCRYRRATSFTPSSSFRGLRRCARCCRHIRNGTAHRALPASCWPSSTTTSAAPASSAEPLLEPLSDRELAVLRFLPTMMSNADIASEMFVSVNTVKTHLKHVYRKLDVADRRDAIRRARGAAPAQPQPERALTPSAASGRADILGASMSSMSSTSVYRPAVAAYGPADRADRAARRCSAVYILYRLRKPISWIVLATFLAIAMSGPVNLLERHMRRGFAIAIAYLAAAARPGRHRRDRGAAGGARRQQPRRRPARLRHRPPGLGQQEPQAQEVRPGLRHHGQAPEGGGQAARPRPARPPAPSPTSASASSTRSSRR